MHTPSIVSTCLVFALASAAPVRAADPAVEPVVVKAMARFDFDAASLRSADRSALLADVAKMKDVSWRSVTAVGHTDSVGNPGYNQRLAQRRADAVKTYLLSQGLDGSMIRTEGKSSAEPLVSNDSAEGRARNRRTEVQFYGVRPAAR